MCLKISTVMKDSYAVSMVFSLSISREVKNGYPDAPLGEAIT